MPDLIATALETEGLWLIGFGAALAGLVRGFTGFGTNVVFLPFAAQVLDPVSVLIALVVMDALGPIPAVPRALRDGEPPEVMRLCAGAVVGGIVGVFVLTSLSQDVFRYAVSIGGISILALVASGFRYRGEVDTKLTVAVGGLAGFLGGAIAAPGPVVIFFYFARPVVISVIRANILLFLLAFDLILVLIFAARGLFTVEPLMIGLAVLPIYLVALVVGSWVFDPGRERVYRWSAYAIITGAAINGLPIWD